MFRSLVPLAVASAILSTTPLAQAPAGQTPSRPGGVGGASTPGAPTPGLPPRDTAQRPQTGTARIRGRVTAAPGNTPLRRAQISLTTPDNPQLRRTTTTDADGRYELVELPGGRYQIGVMKAGYLTMFYGQRRPSEPVTPISVRDGETASSIDFALSKGAVIAVRVTDEFGEPVIGQQVQVQRFQWRPDGRRYLAGAGSGGTALAGTDDRGEIRIYGLTPGEYVIEARRGLFGDRPGTGNDATEGFAATFYPGTLNSEEAQPISVGIGQEVSVQFSLVASRLSRIRGTAEDSRGRPAVGATISLVTSTCGSSNSSGVGQVGPDGTFAVSGVPPGEYRLRFSLRQGDVETESVSVPLTVTGDVTGVAAVLGTGTTVTGRVVYEGTPPPAGQQGWPKLLRVVTPPEPCTPAFAPPPGGDVDPDGNFRIAGASGRVFFAVPGLPPTWMIKSVTLDGTNITDVPLNVNDRRTVSDVLVTLTDKIARVYGYVTDAKGQNLSDYVVVIQPADQREPAVAARIVKTARPDTNGRFEVRGLPPGRYVATAIESMEQNRQYSPEFQKELRRGARDFTLKEGETLSLDLRITTGL